MIENLTVSQVSPEDSSPKTSAFSLPLLSSLSSTQSSSNNISLSSHSSLDEFLNFNASLDRSVLSLYYRHL